jgi:hypothetical protein
LTSRKRGFSVLEALATVMLTAAVLALAWPVGQAATHAAFAVGQQATSATDAALARRIFEAVVEGLPAPPSAGSRGPEGSADRLASRIAPSRPIPCDAAGIAEPVEIALARRRGRTQLVCLGPAGNTIEIFDLGPQPASLSYSADGRIWRDRLQAQASGGPLFVRLASADGRYLWIAAASWPPQPAGPR